MATAGNSTNLAVRLDEQSKSFIAKAAQLRGVSISDYVRMVTVAQARREVSEADQNVMVLSPDEQLEFWNALNHMPMLTEAQRDLGAITRGKP